MNAVVAAGACCECGSCVTVCPHNIIEYVAGRPRQTAKESAPFDHCGVSERVGCDVCATVCPRLWPREEQLRDAVFGDDRAYEGIFGVYRHVFVARTRDGSVLGKAQDGGVVTALLAWARQEGHVEGAVVAAVGEGDSPCFPTPRLATTVEEIKASAGSWYTYCPNNLALRDAKERKLERLAFVGVPCQITPLRKMAHADAGRLQVPGKKPQVISRQIGFLRDPAERVGFSVGLFCTEVFRPELMSEHVAGRMGIPLDEIDKVNVKGEVRIHRRGGEMARIPLEEVIRDYQRPACHHCRDFSAELADISCGGVGTEGATIVVLRTQKGVDIWRAFEASGQVDVRPIAEHKKAWNIMLRLARQQKERLPPGAVRADGDAPAERRGAPIPGDPGEPAPGEKRRLPPPPLPEQGGASPGMSPV